MNIGYVIVVVLKMAWYFVYESRAGDVIVVKQLTISSETESHHTWFMCDDGILHFYRDETRPRNHELNVIYQLKAICFVYSNRNMNQNLKWNIFFPNFAWGQFGLSPLFIIQCCCFSVFYCYPQHFHGNLCSVQSVHQQ